MKYVPYKGGGKVAKQLAGKHANSTVNNPSEQMGFYKGWDHGCARCLHCEAIANVPQRTNLS
ncbi:MAG: hypothetical protein Ct9H300mP28_00720 [Pseudomonadota bacterium]|nr:MAG: hypothetical protein Ct9H300mP28_00720 [Pseudomonadota bacterium]